MRVRTDAEPIRFADRVQGEIAQSVEREVGDFVLLRADGLFAYQLAVVVDDAAQGVTDVVRGADLLDSTARQIHLQRLLGVPTPRYLHVPVATNAAGEKLSKQTQRAGCRARPTFPRRLRFLGMARPAGLAPRELLALGRRRIGIRRAIPRARSIADRALGRSSLRHHHGGERAQHEGERHVFRPAGPLAEKQDAAEHARPPG